MTIRIRELVIKAEIAGKTEEPIKSSKEKESYKTEQMDRIDKISGCNDKQRRER